MTEENSQNPTPSFQPILSGSFTPQPKPESSSPQKVTSSWSYGDYLGAFLCRISGLRNKYTVKPGLYALGNPTEESEVLVTANYKFTFDKLRRATAGLNAWILVLDTKGINVWCAAGKGTFGTTELINRVAKTNLKNYISHKRVIVPQLGAVGVKAHEVQNATGLRISYGPVEARDITEYLKNNRVATPAMRRIRFNWLDRLVLTPMEILPSFKYAAYFSLFALLFFGLQSEGILFAPALLNGAPFILSAFAALLAGALLAPLLLPLLPTRYFFIKGLIMGTLVQAVIYYLLVYRFNFHKLATDSNIFFALSSGTFFPLIASFITLQFTGSTTYTNMSGVYREHKFALPLYVVGSIASLIFLVLYRVRLEGWL